MTSVITSIFGAPKAPAPAAPIPAAPTISGGDIEAKSREFAARQGQKYGADKTILAGLGTPGDANEKAAVQRSTLLGGGAA